MNSHSHTHVFFFKSRINVKNNIEIPQQNTNDLIDDTISKRIFKSFNEKKIINRLEKYSINYFCK